MSRIIDKLKGLEDNKDIREEDLEYAEIVEEDLEKPKKNFLKISVVFIIFLIAVFIGFKFSHILITSQKNVGVSSDKKETKTEKNSSKEQVKNQEKKISSPKPVVFSGGKDFERYLLAKLDKEPENSTNLNNLAVFYYEHNNIDNALKYAQKALILEPENPFFWNTLGIVLTELKLYEDAEKCFKKAIERKPDEGVFYYNLANLYERMDKINLSKENYLLYLSKSDKINPKMLDYVREKLRKGV